MTDPRPHLLIGGPGARLPPLAIVLSGLLTLAVLAVLFVLLLPVALLLVGLLLVGLGLAWLKRTLAPFLPDPEGRRNVRVVSRSDNQP